MQSFHNIERRRALITNPRPSAQWPYRAWDAGGTQYDIRRGDVHGWKAVSVDWKHVFYGRTLADLSGALEGFYAVR